MVSPLASERTASEYDGPYRISDFTACPLSSCLEVHSERVVKAAARRAPEPSFPTVKIYLITRNENVVATLPTGGLRIEISLDHPREDALADFWRMSPRSIAEPFAG
jgi:hypothetical protein